MKGKYMPWLLVVLAGAALLVVIGNPPDSHDKIVAATVRGNSSMQLRAILPRNVARKVGNDDLFGVAPTESQALTSSQAAHRNETLMIKQPDWNVIGKHLDGPSGWTVFLARNDQTLIVRVGDVLEDGYRIDSIVPPVMVLRHTKRNTRNTLDIGEATK